MIFLLAIYFLSNKTVVSYHDQYSKLLYHLTRIKISHINVNLSQKFGGNYNTFQKMVIKHIIF